MYRFIETIRATKGRLEDLRFHQQRVDETLLSFHKSPYFNVASVLMHHTIPNNPISKIRLTYTFENIISIQIEPYSIRSIQSLSLASTLGKRYDCKYEDRSWLQSIVNSVQTDDIILHESDLIKDASYANLAFFDGLDWYTPKHPLLNGTKRRALIQGGKLIERDIYIHELSKYSKVKLINAMMHWDESPEIATHHIVF